MTDIEKKRKKEKEVVEEMIHIYCKKKHTKQMRGNHRLCIECQELCDYANHRSDVCPFMEHKNFCANCKIHCYKPKMRVKIKEVMRFSGPRMLMYHPFMAIWHVICSIKEKKTMKKDDKKRII